MEKDGKINNMEKLDVKLTKHEIAIIIKTLQYYYGMSLRIEMNPSQYLPSVVKEVMDCNKVIKELEPALRDMLK